MSLRDGSSRTWARALRVFWSSDDEASGRRDLKLVPGRGSIDAMMTGRPPPRSSFNHPRRLAAADPICDVLVLRTVFTARYATGRPLSRFLFKFRLADKKIQLISGLAEYSRNLRNSAGIWLTNDKFG